ncbi:cytochrome c [uncultured Alsobacter sp.]|uniref:c-type cytochrome n=1 Tax=uncultured Alsobacter sp. TaxID=1748258 RepID=UPI0025F9AAF9|nr:cytochrome c [uncultured Alsobacter sp.]
MLRPARWLAALLLLCGPAAAADLTLRIGGQTRVLTQAELLASPDAIEMPVPQTSPAARAVPLLQLLKGLPTDDVDTLEVQASDGFTSQIPMALVRKGAQGGSVAYMAVEDPAKPWQPLPKGTGTAGPFYLVWQNPTLSGITSEQWPWQVATIVGVESPAHRWPQIAVAAGVGAAARHGQDVFVAQCMPCHRMKGGGSADVGPDLGRPMPAAAYLTEAGLRALIRDPKAVRTWPQQQMVGFDRSMLSDADLDAVVAYLQAMAR